jgi:hypothetical protein
MKSRITALNQFNRRERLRKKFALYLLLILLSVFVFEEGIAIVGQNREVYIENAQASVLSVKIPEEKVADSPDSKASEVLNTSASEIPQESSSQLSLEEMVANTFPENPTVAVALFKTESGMNAEAPSITDIMEDGRPFSTGLAQINLTAHEIDGVACYKAFQGRNYKAVVIDEVLYQKCLKMANNPRIALGVARKEFESRGETFNAWGAFKSGAYLKYL